MSFALLAVALIGAITIPVTQVLSSEVGGGVESLEADQVFNVAQAGVHYGIGKLQLATAITYTGVTRTITTGSTTLGTATITVHCVDTTSDNNWNPASASTVH